MPKRALRSLLAIALCPFMTAAAHACLFARDTQPEHWYEWASVLFAADVTRVEQERPKALDIITVRVSRDLQRARRKRRHAAGSQPSLHADLLRARRSGAKD